MAQTQAQYINRNLAELENYINYLVDFSKEYDNAVKDLCSKSNAEKITKSEETIKQEKEIKESYETAMNLYNDLRRIADKYRNRMNIDSDLQWFHNRLNSARFPIYERTTLKLKHSKQNGVPTGGAAEVKKTMKQGLAEYAIGNNYNPEFYIIAKSTFGPDTAGMLDMAHEKRNDLSYTKDAIKLTNWNDPRVASDKEYLRGKVIKGFSYYDYDEDNVPGYFFKNYSEPSKRIANDKDFLEKIKSSKNEILSNKKVSMGFPSYGPNTKSNLYYAFGKIDIRNGYIDKNGNLHVKVYDTYDFNPEEKNKPLVMAGKNKMLDGELKPFFTIHDIIIPKETLKELWK